MPYDEFMSTIKGFFRMPNESSRGWETANAAMKRVSSCVEDIMKKSHEENIVLVGHGVAFALLLSYIKGVKPVFNLCQDGVGFISEVDWEKREIISRWRKY